MGDIKINLMPREYTAPRKAGVLEWGLGAAAALAMLAGGVYYMGVAAEASELGAQATATEQRLQVVKTQVAEAATIGQREQRVARAEGELKGLVGRRWSTVLLTLRDLTPQHVTWQSLAIEKDAMTLKATSSGLVDVAQLFAGLLANKQVADVSLHYVNEAGIKVEYKADAGKGSKVPKEELRPVGEYRQLEFELTITLNPQEGGVPNGA